MGMIVCRDSEEQSRSFVEALKSRGAVSVAGERELLERLGEVRSWRSAFVTLVRSGSRLGIEFEPRGHVPALSVARLFKKFGFGISDWREFMRKLAVKN